MPGDYKPGRIERVSKRRKGQPKQHAGHPIVRGGQQLPTYKGKPVGPGTGKVKGVPSIGKLLPGKVSKVGKASAKAGRGQIEDRRVNRRPVGTGDHFPWSMSDAGRKVIRKSIKRPRKGGV